jgi:hypothetical protein
VIFHFVFVCCCSRPSNGHDHFGFQPSPTQHREQHRNIDNAETNNIFINVINVNNNFTETRIESPNAADDDADANVNSRSEFNARARSYPGKGERPDQPPSPDPVSSAPLRSSTSDDDHPRPVLHPDSHTDPHPDSDTDAVFQERIGGTVAGNFID